MCDPAAEKGILAGIYSFGEEIYTDVSDLVGANSFTVDVNKIIYRCLSEIFVHRENKVVDVPTILSVAHSLGYAEFFTDKGNLAHLKAITHFPVEKENVRKLAAKVKKLEIAESLTRQLDKSKVDLSQITGLEPIFQILGLAENPIFDFTASLASEGEGPIRIGSKTRSFIQNIIDNPVDQVGIPTGNPIYDYMIGGALRRKSVNLIGARPKRGKTTLGVNIIRHITSLGVPVINLDTEMSEDDHHIKMVSCISGVDLKKVETGRLTKEEKEKVFAAIDEIEKLPYFYHSVGGMPIEDVLSSCRRWIKKDVGMTPDGRTKDCVVVLDWIKLSGDSEITNVAEYQRLGFIMTALHNFIKKMDVANLTFSQLNRDGIAKVETDVVAGSDRLIWFTGSFSIFREMPDEEITSKPKGFPYNRQLIPLVSRYGEGMEKCDYICYEFNKLNARIKEGPTRVQLEKMLQSRTTAFNIGDVDEPVAA